MEWNPRLGPRQPVGTIIWDQVGTQTIIWDQVPSLSSSDRRDLNQIYVRNAGSLQFSSKIKFYAKIISDKVFAALLCFPLNMSCLSSIADWINLKRKLRHIRSTFEKGIKKKLIRKLIHTYLFKQCFFVIYNCFNFFVYLSPFHLSLCPICENQLTTVVVIIWGNTTNITTRTCTSAITNTTTTTWHTISSTGTSITTATTTSTWHNTCGGSISNSESAPVRVHSGRRSVLGQSEAKNTRDKYSFKRIPRASIVSKYFNSCPLCPCWGITFSSDCKARVSRDKQQVRCKDNNLSSAVPHCQLNKVTSLSRNNAAKLFHPRLVPGHFASCPILLLSSYFQRVVLWKV